MVTEIRMGYTCRVVVAEDLPTLLEQLAQMARRIQAQGHAVEHLVIEPRSDLDSGASWYTAKVYHGPHFP